MDKQIVYAGQIPRRQDFHRQNNYGQIALARLAEDVFFSRIDPENNATAVRAAGFKPTFNGTMNITLAAGRIYTAAAVDATTYGSEAADSRVVVHQGQVEAATLTIGAAPGTVGHSRIDIIQGKLNITDTDSEVLEYYNSADPDTPYIGPGGGGGAQNTRRAVGGLVSVKAGTAGVTPSAPSPDAGYTTLFQVTVAYGQTSVAAGHMSPVTGIFFPGLATAGEAGGLATLDSSGKVPSGQVNLTTLADQLREYPYAAENFGISLSTSPVTVYTNTTGYPVDLEMVLTFASGNTGQTAEVTVGGLKVYEAVSASDDFSTVNRYALGVVLPTETVVLTLNASTTTWDATFLGTRLVSGSVETWTIPNSASETINATNNVLHTVATDTVFRIKTLLLYVTSAGSGAGSMVLTRNNKAVLRLGAHAASVNAIYSPTSDELAKLRRIVFKEGDTVGIKSDGVSTDATCNVRLSGATTAEAA